MKLSILALSFIALVLPGSVKAQAVPIAKPHWYQRGPLGDAERSIAIMAHPQKNPKLALAHYLIFAADMLDYGSTVHVLSHCPHCAELNPLYSKHPSVGRVFGEGLTISLFSEHAPTEWLYESESRDGYNPKAFWITTGGATGLHAGAGIHNLLIHPKPDSVAVQASAVVLKNY